MDWNRLHSSTESCLQNLVLLMCSRERRSCCYPNAYITHTYTRVLMRESVSESVNLFPYPKRSAAHLICKSHSLGRWCGALEIGSDGGGVFRTLCLSNKQERIVCICICALVVLLMPNLHLIYSSGADAHNCSFVCSTIRGRLRHVSLNDNWRRWLRKKKRRRHKGRVTFDIVMRAFSISLACLLLACAVVCFLFCIKRAKNAPFFVRRSGCWFIYWDVGLSITRFICCQWRKSCKVARRNTLARPSAALAVVDG